MSAMIPPYGMGMVPPMPVKTNAEVISTQLASMKKDWKANIDKIRGMKGSIRFELMIYFFVVSVMLFFIVIILSDLYNTFRFNQMINKDSRHESYRNNKRNALDDDNDYGGDGYGNFVNTNEYIMSSLEQKDRNVNKHFENLLAFKKRHNIDTELSVGVDERVLGSANDDYKYPALKNTPFTELLFSEPDYNFINRAGGSLA